jgi:DNA damage-binding protein 1
MPRSPWLAPLRPARGRAPVQVTGDRALANRKSVTLGLKPITLSPFDVGGRPHVFAATDRPAVVYEHAGKLLYSPVNESNVSHVCPFSSPAFPGALAMAKDDGLMIALMDSIQKLHIRCAACSRSTQRPPTCWPACVQRR